MAELQITAPRPGWIPAKHPGSPFLLRRNSLRPENAAPGSNRDQAATGSEGNVPNPPDSGNGQPASSGNTPPPRKKLVIFGCIALLALCILGISALVNHNRSGVVSESGGAAVTDIPGDDAYSLTKTGEVEDADKQFVLQHDGGRLWAKTETADGKAEYHLLGHNGKILPDTACRAFFDFSDTSHDFYFKDLKHQSDFWANSTRAELADGRPCIFREINDRYIVKRTFTQGDVPPILVTIYDLDTGCAIDIQQPGMLPYAIGDSSLVFQDEVSGKVTFCSSSGEILETCSGSLKDVHDRYALIQTAEGFELRDENGTMLNTFDQPSHFLDGGSLICTERNGTAIIVDVNGNEIPAPPSGEYIYQSGKYLVYRAIIELHSENPTPLDPTGQIREGLVTLDGKEVLPCTYDYIRELVPGYLTAVTGGYEAQSQSTIVGPDGVIASNLINTTPTQLLITDRDRHRAMIINTHEFDFSSSEYLYPRYCLTGALIACKDSHTKLLGVHDLFTGEQLLAPEYKKFQCIRNHLYAFKDGVWEIYQVNYLEGKP